MTTNDIDISEQGPTTPVREIYGHRLQSPPMLGRRVHKSLLEHKLNELQEKYIKLRIEVENLNMELLNVRRAVAYKTYIIKGQKRDLDIYKLPDEDDDKLFDAILKEMGYYDDEDEDDLREDFECPDEEDETISNMSREELKTMIQNIVLDTMEDEDDLNEIIENITKN